MSQTKQAGTTRKPRKRFIKPDTYDFGLLFVVLTLVLFGVVMIFSASYYSTMTSEAFHNDMFYYLKRQGMWAILGIMGMIVCMNIPYQFWKRFAFLLI